MDDLIIGTLKIDGKNIFGFVDFEISGGYRGESLDESANREDSIKIIKHLMKLFEISKDEI